MKKQPKPVRFSLKVFNDDWARYGQGPMWPVLDFSGDYEDHAEFARATRKAQTDPTDYGLAKLLSTDADELTDGSLEFWLSLVFADYVRNSVVLPLEIDTYNTAKAIAQIDLEHQSSSGTPENMRLAKHWLHSCLQNHPRCRSSAPARTSDWLSSDVFRVSITVKTPTVSNTDGRGLAVNKRRLRFHHKPMTDMKETTTRFQRAWRQVQCQTQSTFNKIIRKAQLGGKRISRKRQSILDDSGIRSALRWGYDRLLKPLCYGFLLLLALPLILLLVGILLALMPFIPIIVGIHLAHEALGSLFKIPDIETGRMVPSADDSKDSVLRASCFFDCAPAPSETDNEQQTFIIPILDGHRTSGLIVQLVEVPGTDGDRHYKRLGVFEMNSFELRKFRTTDSGSSGSSLAEETFYLI